MSRMQKPDSGIASVTATGKVAIIIVAWNHYDLTQACIRSLLELDYPDVQIVVVDNASTDGTPDSLRADFGAQVHLICNESNLGFTGGNNVGIRYALQQPVEYIMLLNNDTIVAPTLVSCLIHRVLSIGGVGIATPKVYFLNDPQRLWAAGGKINKWLGKAANRGFREKDEAQYDVPSQVDYAPGCCLLASREIFEHVGLLQEEFFTYFEDADWSQQARDLGYPIWYEPTAEVWHVAGGSRGGQTSARSHYFVTRNNLWYIHRNIRGPQYPIALISFAGRHLLRFSFAFILLRRWTKLRSLWKGVRDGWHKPTLYDLSDDRTGD